MRVGFRIRRRRGDELRHVNAKEPIIIRIQIIKQRKPRTDARHNYQNKIPYYCSLDSSRESRVSAFGIRLVLISSIILLAVATESGSSFPSMSAVLSIAPIE